MKYDKNTTELQGEKSKEFDKIVRPLIKWLAENHHPHCTIIVTNTNAELVEGKMSTGEILDYIKD